MNITQVLKAIKTKECARSFAIQWQSDFDLKAMDWGQLALWSVVFRKLGKKFGLLREFKDNGIL